MEKRLILKTLIAEGLVQGVGLRPFVYHLAQKYNLKGWVKNTKSGVIIEAAGDSENIDAFLMELKNNPPPLAIIKTIKESDSEKHNVAHHGDFEIISSSHGEEAGIFISPDVAICSDCADDFGNKTGRFHAYPFVNCTNCGPRYSIITDYPYDRVNTTMNEFAMCDKCAAEYKDIHSRRYHAEPVSCSDCGPQFELLDNTGKKAADDDVFETARHLLKIGKIIAVKGLGGYHLIADAENKNALAELRNRKKRDTKPFAVLFRDTETVEKHCFVTEKEKELLLSKERPIVLLRKKNIISSNTPVPNAQSPVPDPISGSSPYYGAMLPYAPFHYLLLREFPVLICTSGNISGEPIVYRDDDIERLKDIADYFLMHNRKIVRFVEDSVVKIVNRIPTSLIPSPPVGEGEGGGALNSGLATCNLQLATTILMRKSRGYAPLPLFLKEKSDKNIVGLGGDLKGSISIMKDDVLFQSQYLGDLEDYLSYEDYVRCYDDMKKIFQIEPDVFVCDLHPSYHSTKFAEQVSQGKPLIKVQHHKAHIASVAFEKGWFDENVIGVALDGTGYGEDGAIWGGEVFAGSLTNGFERKGRLSYVPLPFGDSAVKYPQKTALSYFIAAGIEDERLFAAYDDETKKHYESLKRFVKKSPVLTSSTGRLFDAVSFLLGFRRVIGYEGEAAIELENLAHNSHIPLFNKGGKGRFSTNPYNTVITEKNGLLIFEVMPIITDIFSDWTKGEAPSVISVRFHSTIIAGFMEIVKTLTAGHGITKVALSGGSFQNSVLLQGFIDELEKAGLTWAINQYSPPNDACVSIGQCALAQLAKP